MALPLLATWFSEITALQYFETWSLVHRPSWIAASPLAGPLTLMVPAPFHLRWESVWIPAQALCLTDAPSLQLRGVCQEQHVMAF